MIAYLLHKLPEAEREAFEDRWMEDSELYGELQDAEAELLDAYANGALPAGDCELVTKYLLSSPVQERKLLFARTLRAALPAHVRPASERQTRAWRSIAAAGIILLAIATSWLAWQNTALHRRLAGVSNFARPPAPAVYVAEIPSGTTNRSTTQSLAEVRVPAGAQMLRLDLQLDPGDETRVFSATVGQEGRLVWDEEPIHAERRPFGFVVPVWVPAAVLTPGQYQIKLSAGGTLIDYYRFRLRAVR
ncbi:MAG TPA: hypothetical protein VME17_17810 [Bryobacteraceae bacterium]|nr:hypothetical protein [Bryobacteraceae bacterium]